MLNALQTFDTIYSNYIAFREAYKEKHGQYPPLINFYVEGNNRCLLGASMRLNDYDEDRQVKWNYWKR